jgi:micrococcal nuclease
MGLGLIIGVAQTATAGRQEALPPPTSTVAPTFTLLPTSTFTSTVILTPTQTLTPTLTFTPTVTFTPTLTFTPTITLTPTVTLPPLAAADCVSPTAERQTGVVTKITDGDTIHVNIDGVDYPVRYIGIDTPEVGAKDAAPAAQYNSYLVLGKTVTLIKDVSETDRYDRLLRYVFVGNVFVNYELVARGYATSGTWEPDTACDSTFAAAMAAARSKQLGMWAPTSLPATSIPATALPVAGIPTKTPSPSLGSNCDAAYPDFCIPSPPPDLDCKDVAPHKRFKVLSPDPHHFDSDGDGVGCES